MIRSSRELEVKNRDARFFQACPDSSESLGSDKYSLPKPHIPTGGRLYHFRKAWKNISTDKWTQSVIRNWYRIQFRVRPKLTRVVPQFLRATPTLRSREDSTSTDRSKIYAGQTCHRTSFLLPSKGWLLQQALSGSQEVGRMETSNRSVPTKSACNHSSFQDGNFRLGSSFFTEARLGHFPRLDRCILS